MTMYFRYVCILADFHTIALAQRGAGACVSCRVDMRFSCTATTTVGGCFRASPRRRATVGPAA